MNRLLVHPAYPRCGLVAFRLGRSVLVNPIVEFVLCRLDSAVQWLHNGAQPTDTAKAILSYKGALLKHHLDGGVRKGALTQEQADAKLATWLDAKAGKVDAKKDGLSKAQADAKAKAFKAEQAANEKRIAAIADAAKAEEVVEAAAEVTEEVAEEVVEGILEVDLKIS